VAVEPAQPGSVSLAIEQVQRKDAHPEEGPVDLNRLMDFTDGTPENTRELVDLYLSQTSEQLVKLRDAIAKSSTDEVRRLAHSAAGASGTCGVKPLAALLRKLEQQATEQDLSEATVLAQQIAGEFAHARVYLERYLEGLSRVGSQALA